MAKTDSPRLTKLLGECGLTATETAVVRDLLERGEVSVGAMARRLESKRPTLYSALSSLELRGLVQKRKLRGVSYFALMPREELPLILKTRAQARYDRVAQAAALLTPALKQFGLGGRQRLGGYEITSFESRQATEEFVLTVLTRGHYVSLFDPGVFAGARWRRVLLKFLEQSAAAAVPIREIVTDSRAAQWYMRNIRNPNHAVRVLEGRFKLITDCSIIGDRVVLNSYEPGSEISLQIRHGGYAQMMRLIFERLWQSLPPRGG